MKKVLFVSILFGLLLTLSSCVSSGPSYKESYDGLSERYAVLESKYDSLYEEYEDIYLKYDELLSDFSYEDYIDRYDIPDPYDFTYYTDDFRNYEDALTYIMCYIEKEEGYTDPGMANDAAIYLWHYIEEFASYCSIQ